MGYVHEPLNPDFTTLFTVKVSFISCAELNEVNGTLQNKALHAEGKHIASSDAVKIV